MDSNHQKDIDSNIYLEERKTLVNFQYETSRSLDKAILTLSSGAFGVSFAFIKQIVPQIKKDSLSILEYSWLLFGLSIILTLISFLTSQWACSTSINILEKGHDRKNIPGIITQIINVFSMVIFIIGVFLLIKFGIANLEQ